MIFSLTTTGLFYDQNPMAPILEFIRCSFLFLYSRNGIPLLASTLTWMEFGEGYLEYYSYMVLYSYFFFSALFWGLVSARFINVFRSTQFKIKTN